MKKTSVLRLSVWAFSYLFLVMPASMLTAQEIVKPRLILQITVDQLRGDLPTRYYDRLGDGGLKYLLDTGTVYANAHHRHANTETIVGHTTLATGADPSIHGMVGNVWFDRNSGELTYNVEDANYPILSKDAGVDKKNEVDPTQKTARSDGRSPNRILVSTFGDELKLNTGGKSKVFGVSVKDRGAISMAGHTGKAYWFSKKSGKFITSQFYHDKYPNWVSAWNDGQPTQKYVGKSWELLNSKSTYVFGDKDDRPYETAMPGFGRTFPHPYGKAGDKYFKKLFTTYLTMSPAGDELTLDFAKALIQNEQIGKDNIPDYLSVSFSSSDYVGHIFGPSSLEAEDNILRLDRTLANLLEYVDAEIGLNNTLIVLSSDHGGPETPGYLEELGFEAKYIDPSSFDKSSGIEALKKRFGIGAELITTYFHPYVYLNRKLIAEKKLDQDLVEQAVAAQLEKFEGITLAVPSSALREGRHPDSPLFDAVLKNYNRTRSGDIYVVFDPNRFINDFGKLKVAATHGSPWRYDTHVPIIFAGMNFPAKKINRLVHTVDIAPTLSLIVGAKPPTGSFSKPLIEVFETKK